jgi:hypothetical protein
MTAQELFDKYSNLSYLETIKFDIMYQAHTQKVQDELEATKRTYLINVAGITTEKAHATLAKMMELYKEDVILDESIQDESYYDNLRGVKFTEDDIKDKERLEQMVEKEANAIYKSNVGNNGRDLDTVKFCVRQGKVAELWLIENREYKEANKKYHDLVDKDGNYTEVKAYSVDNVNAPFIQKDLKKIRTESWNTSRWYIVFKFTHGEYEFLEKIEI